MVTPEDLDAVHELLPDGVVVADASRTVVHANGMARRLVGETLQEGRPLAEALALQDQEGHDWFTCVRPYDGLGIRTRIPEQAWFTPDGTELLLTARIHRDSPHDPVQSVAVVIRSARGREVLDRERSDLVATVAHELRSPLTGVKGFVSTLLSKWERLNDEQKKLMLTTVHSDSERLTRLITELLDVARIDTGRLQLYPREIAAPPLLDRVVESVRAGTSRPITVTHADPAAVVFADPDKLVQVFTNLVDNAVRHGDGEVRVATEPGELGLRVTVDDEGEGIPEGLRTRVFTKFWKHGARGGSGLGMYIVNGLVRVHGGDLQILDAPGGGARIVVDWPADDRRTATG